MSMRGTITYLSPGEIDGSGELHWSGRRRRARVGGLVFASRSGESSMTLPAGLSGACFSLWVLVLARTKPRKLKHAPLAP